MTSRDFCFWLQGFFELSDEKKLSEHQIDLIKAHLNMVFKHEIDPSHGDQDMQKLLNELHEAGKKPDKKPTSVVQYPAGHGIPPTLMRC